MRETPHAGTPPDGQTTGQAREPLGDKLARSDGVLCPPAGIDPEIRAPTPEAGNTPVIPPPGSPGGDRRSGRNDGRHSGLSAVARRAKAEAQT